MALFWGQGRMGIRKAYRDDLAAEGEKMKGLIRTLRHKVEPEALHRFRVSVKRLRAYRRWLKQMGYQDEPPKMWSRLRRVFRVAGEWRDRDLAGQSFLGKEPTPEDQDLAGMFKSLRIRDLKRWLGGLRAAIPGKGQSGPALMAFLLKRQKAMKRQIDQLPGTRPLHRIRRDLKEYGYLLAIWTAMPEVAGKGKDLNDRVEARQKILGVWHDQVILYQMAKASHASERMIAKMEKKLATLNKKATHGLADLVDDLGDMLRTCGPELRK